MGRWRESWSRVRRSAFFEPLCFLLGAVVLTAGTIWVLVNTSGSGAPAKQQESKRAGDGAAERTETRLERQRREFISALVDELESSVAKKDLRISEELISEIAGQGQEAVSRVLWRLEGEGSWNFRMALLKALSRIPTKRALDATVEYYRTLGSHEAGYKVEVVRMLARSRGTLSRPAIADLLKGETDETVRREMSRTLVDLGMTRAEVSMLDAKDAKLVEEPVRQRTAVVDKLEQIRTADGRTPEGRELVISAAANDSTIAVAVAAFQKLEALNDDQSADTLLDRARQKPAGAEGEIIRTNAMASLARMTVARALTAMRELILSEDQALRNQAIALVGALGSEAMIPVLEQAAKADPSAGKIVDNAILALRSRTKANGSR